MKEKLKLIGRIIAATTLVVSGSVGIYRGLEELSGIHERKIDAMCGGPARSERDVIEKYKCFGGAPWGQVNCGNEIQYKKRQ